MSQLPTESDTPLTAAAAYAVLSEQQKIVASRFGRSTRIITAVWGVAWLLGFLTIWQMDVRTSVFAIPVWLGWSIFATLFAAAVVISGVLGMRGDRGIRSNSANAFTGAVYGVSWVVSILAINVFGAALISRGMNEQLADLFYPSAYALVVGIMYLAAAAIWRVAQLLVAGVVLIVLAASAPFIGHPANYLLFAIVGGALFFGLAIVSRVRSRVRGARG